MARPKKKVMEEPAVKPAEAEAVEPKTEAIKSEETAAPAQETAEEAVKPARTSGRRKKTETAAASAPKTEKKESAKKETAKKETVKQETAEAPVAKAAKKNALYIQYADQNRSEEELFKIAKDVWKYDLERKLGDLESIELYVKPEERKAYYVMNGDITGSFDI